MDWVNDEIDYTIQRLGDALRTEQDPVLRKGLTELARRRVAEVLDRVDHEIVLRLREQIGYYAAVETFGKHRVDRAMREEAERNPAFRVRSGPRAKAHQPDPGTAVHFTRTATAGN